MTLVKINLGDIGTADVTAQRAVGFAVPVHRGSETVVDRVVSTGQRWVDVVDGLGSIELEPGPVEITILVGRLDSSPKRANVPNQDEVTLRELLEDSFEYEPAVVSAARQAAVRAEEAAVRAEEAAAGGGGGAALIESPPGSGLYSVAAAGLTEDPDNPGLYEIGS